MPASSRTSRSATLTLAVAIALAGALFAVFTALGGSNGTTDSKPPRPHASPAAATSSSSAALTATPSATAGCNIFDAECQAKEHPSAGTHDDETGTGAGAGGTRRLPDPPRGTAATGGGGSFDGTE